MTVAHDAATESATWTTTPDPFTIDHTPVGTPRAVIMFTGQSGGGGGDRITGAVTYGGVAMTRVPTDGFAADTAGETGAAYCYFLGSGIPTGTQTVSIDHNAGPGSKWTVIISCTAGGDTEIVVSAKDEGDQANPSAALDTVAVEALRYAIIFSGHDGIANVTPLTGMTAVHDVDYGTQVSRVDRETTASTGSFTIGWTATSEDVAAIYIAVQEVAVGGTQNLTGTLFTKTPTFNTGTITSTGALAGVLFQRAPTFSTGVVSLSAVSPTRFYIPAFNTPDISPAFSAGWEVTDATVRRTLQRAPQDRLETGSVISEWLLAAETSTSVVDVAVFQAVSDPVGAGTISGFVKGSMSCRESAVGADARTQMRLVVVSNDGSTIRGVLLELDESALSNEWNTVARTRHFPLNWTGSGAALSSVAALEGDRIVCEVGFRAHNTSASSLNGEIRLTSDHANTDAPEAEDTLGTSLRGWIEFSQPIALPAAVNAYETELRAKGVLFHWPLDETSGTVLRDGEQKHSQFVTGGAPTLNQSGPTSLLRAVSFDGVDDYTYANPTDEVYPDASGVIWVKTDNIGQAHGRGAFLIGENGNAHCLFEQLQDGVTWKWNYHYRDNAAVARDLPLNAIVANQWEFIAFTLDGDVPALRVYMAVAGVVTELASDLVNVTSIWFSDVRLGTDKNLDDFGDYVVAGPALFDSTLTLTDLQDIYDAATGDRVSQVPNATTSNVGWDTAPLAGQAIHTYIATDDSNYITVTVP